VQGDFERYKRHMDEVRDAFLVDVLGIPPKSIRFECSEAHRDAADGAYKWSIHELLRGYYLEDFHARNEFKRAFEHFQRNLPAHLQHCDEFLWHTPDPQRGPKLIWDPSVFAKFKCFRMLYSRKRGSDRPLVPVDGCSPQLLNHLVGIYSAEELASLQSIDVGVLERYNQKVGVDAGKRCQIPRRHTTRVVAEGGSGEGGTRDDALGAPLTAHELERLTSVYREDHPGAEIRPLCRSPPTSSPFTSASSSRCAASLGPLTTAPATTEGTSCTSGAIRRWPTTSATPRGAGELAGVTVSLQAAWYRKLGISQNLRLYVISLVLISLQILTDCPSAKRMAEDHAPTRST
jgi:hypothetical protein